MLNEWKNMVIVIQFWIILESIGLRVNILSINSPIWDHKDSPCRQDWLHNLQGLVQKRNAETLIQKWVRTSGQRQQHIKPSTGPFQVGSVLLHKAQEGEATDRMWDEIIQILVTSGNSFKISFFAEILKWPFKVVIFFFSIQEKVNIKMEGICDRIGSFQFFSPNLESMLPCYSTVPPTGETRGFSHPLMLDLAYDSLWPMEC